MREPRGDGVATVGSPGNAAWGPGGSARVSVRASLIAVVLALALALAVGGRAHAQRGRIVDLRDGTDVAAGPASGERALVLMGADIAVASGRIPGPGGAALRRHLETAYDRMEREMPGLPSPRAAGDERALLIAPARTGARGIVFLHGYGGSFALQCWAIARAAPDLLTLCPSIGDEGAWWTARGEARVRSAVALLRARGVSRVVLVGLSNGARGAAELAPRMRRIEGVELERVVLVSGASRRARPVVPTLVITGRSDRMSSAAHARRYAARAARRARVSALPGTNFVLIERLDEVAAEIRGFLAPG